MELQYLAFQHENHGIYKCKEITKMLFEYFQIYWISVRVYDLWDKDI